MGIEIKQGLDSTIDDASNLTGSATGWASRIIEVVEALKSGNNELGSAAKKPAVQAATAGAVPELDSNGKIALAQLQTATAGGSSNGGLIPLLTGDGLIPSTMISGSGTGAGGGGVRAIWMYSNQNQFGTGGTWYSNTRRWLYEWLPRDRSNNYVNVTSALIFITGGGGAGAHGPAAHTDRKGGGGGAGSTVIAVRTGLTNNSVINVWVGHGGDEMQSGSVGTNNDGASSGIGTSGTNLEITAGGGSRGSTTGNGGQSNSGGVGNQATAIYLHGGSGRDGLFDRLGAGAGGASFWGGGFSGGNGRGGGRTVAWGSGGGAASGSLGVSPYTFTANAPGKAGSHGVVVIIGF